MSEIFVDCIGFFANAITGNTFTNTSDFSIFLPFIVLCVLIGKVFPAIARMRRKRK